jgi:uncharacterized membrane protein
MERIMTTLAETLRRDWHSFTEAERRAVLAALHPHMRARNANDLEDERLTGGHRQAEAGTTRHGSWRFIVVQSMILAGWVALNVIGWIRHWDPYPFILLNLALSFQAAYSAPIIMMSQNRQAAKDRLVSANDYTINLRAEAEVAAIQARLDDLSGRQWEALLAMQQQQIELLEAIHQLTRELHASRSR